jgi:hypothetical protein
VWIWCVGGDVEGGGGGGWWTREGGGFNKLMRYEYEYEYLFSIWYSMYDRRGFFEDFVDLILYWFRFVGESSDGLEDIEGV